ncbi:hypothetical protein AB0M94_02705 [Streptomyces xanthochromogenes]|uniref:Uncharacterized protein n=1 Tax=Streptomyces xanthochromogenes TaxID=67384 RepID=A0ABQ2ZLB2_9ACTN|nr:MULTISPECIES: hypothetical protein [Streptomyces]MYV91140.1 hypothetical protein [Streptomyces sp. SID1034]GGY17117.1 hypothetical protein GCM10010326_06730 [Streptomyces xanthochromogenes]GHB33630.1 hypothetical protein GCM10010331_21090 [Streptomyces xanthochromogenes]
MTTYVVTIPGTLLAERTEATIKTLENALRPADPRGTQLGEAEHLEMLTFYSGSSAFSIRLEVEADDTKAAEQQARQTVSAALRTAGYSQDQAPLGDATITGITE